MLSRSGSPGGKETVGLEIERARALLAALTRDGVVPADRATASYEAWVASETEAPFARHLIRERPQDAERIRYLLRSLTVQGLPHPDKFTAERFEDLLMGQLGIEAGLLSAKLLQTVRAVQDKKVEEGKLRRLEELLPRAGFDEKALRLLRNHLSERVLICKGCLSRFPRREKSALRLECPRCALELVVPACEASQSDVRDLNLSAEQQMQLEKSVSSEASGVFETLTIAARERGRGAPPADASKAILPLVVVLGAVLFGVFLVSNRQPQPPPPPLRPTSTDDGATEGPDPARDAPTLAEARILDRRLSPAGKWPEILDAWRAAEPGPDEPAAEGKAEKARRVAELEKLVALSDVARGLLDQSRARPDDAALEAALARTLDGAPTGSPPFDEVAAELERRRGRHANARRAEAQKRLDAARAQAGSSGGDAWSARLAQARRGAPLMGVEVGGRVVDGLVIEGLDARGFAVRLPDGGGRTLSWTDDPPLGLAIMRRAVDKGQAAPEDQLELLRRALCARDAAAASTAATALGLSSIDLDPAALVARAPLSAPCVALEGGGHRLRWPTRWAGHDLTAGRPIEVRPGGGLLVQGDKPQVSTPQVDVAPVDGARVSATVRLGEAARALLAVDLGGGRSRRSYVVRWDEAGWTLEVDLGAGSNVLKRGTGGGASRVARLEVAQNEVALFLDGVERARAPTSAKFERVGVRVGAAAGPLVIDELALEGSIDPAWARRTEEGWAATVDAQVEALGRRLTRKGAKLPAVQDEPRAEPAQKAKLDGARASFEAGRAEEAAAALVALEAEAPGLHAARLARGGLALLADDPATAIRALAPSVDALPEAEALLALALARAGRGVEANERAGRALERSPDLVHAHLARARLAWHDRDPVQPAPAESIEQGLRLAEALAPEDAVVRAEAATLRRGLRLDASLPWRLVVGPYVLLGAGADIEVPAREMGKALEGLALRYEQETRSTLPQRRPQAVALVEAQLLEGWGARGDALWEPGLELLAVRTTAGLGWDVAVAAAEAFVFRCHGAPPAWLEVGLAAWLAAPAAGEVPPGALEALERAPAWGPAKWRELFDAERAVVRQSPLMRARAFGLVALAAKQAPTQAVITALLEKSARGEPAPWVDDPSVELQGLDAQVLQAVQQRR